MVKIYTFVQEIDNLKYSGRVCAHSWMEAQTLVPFAIVDGELVAEIPYEIEDRFMMVIPSKPQVH